ncbi:MAG TPA: ABC transporter ATP-binding protein, partial [Actinomycetes bacterium]|nr:ABC transporter ATP-binding protein [Actinomycetes bacterium]
MSRTASAEQEKATAGTEPPVPAIATSGLHKAYGSRVALHDLTLTVPPGEVFGFLGPNGAGKTTAMKILLGLVRPTAGEALVFGRPPAEPAARRRIGYLPEHFRFQEWATGTELLDFHGRLAGLGTRERAERIPELLERVGLAGRGGERVRRYSKGMTQRLGLALALLHRPDLVLLDEPTSALDPVGRREVRELVRELAAGGVTVFLNSHLLTEVEAVCHRVAIVSQGRVVASGPLDDLAGAVTQLRVLLDRVDREVLALLSRHGQVARVEGMAVTLDVDTLDLAPDLARELVAAGYRLYGLVPVQRSL